MKILVTGSTGMVGSALVKQLVDDGHEVRILRRASSELDLLGTYKTHVDHSIGDILDPFTLRNAVSNIEVVFHTAATVGFSPGRHTDPYQANDAGTANMINASLAAGVDRFVHTSSIAALGRDSTSNSIIDESRAWIDSTLNSRYAISKHEAEMEVHRGIAEGLDAVIVNPSLIFGECRRGENTSAILERVRKQKVPGVPVGGTNAVDVLDVVNGHILALEKGTCGERYVLAGNNLLWKDLLGTIADVQGVPLTKRSLNPRYFIPGAYVAEKLSRLVGLSPMITLETARMTARYFKYSSDKAATELGYSFRPFRDTIERLSS